ncbi:MAG: hypothetical protein ACP5I4_08920 [Oceanipulchritudo sp.]
MSTESTDEIRACLAVVLGRKEGDLRLAIRHLDLLRESVRGHLGHYLGKRSYQKAWILLEGGDPEKGTCYTKSK